MTDLALGVEPPPAPSEEQAKEGLRRFVEIVRARYGSALYGVFLFGSRARGDNRPDSDADVAVVVAAGRWNDVAESVELANESFQILLDHALDIHPRVVAETIWLRPDRGAEPGLLERIASDATRLYPAP